MLFGIGLWTFPRFLLRGSAAIALENVALRHRLMVLQRSARRPHLVRWDRILWVWLSRVWNGWRSTLVIVQPATVLAWYRQGFWLYWRWKSRPYLIGCPKLAAEISPPDPPDGTGESDVGPPGPATRRGTRVMWAGSSLLPRLAGSIIAISGSSDRRRAGQPRLSA
jgi:hypothetical protein